jgi:DNA-binding NtrC family response regulator
VVSRYSKPLTWTRRLHGHVAEAQDAATALAVAREQVPAIVVPDVRMAGDIPASTLCEHFLKQGVPVIAVTGVTPGAEQDALREAR